MTAARHDDTISSRPTTARAPHACDPRAAAPSAPLLPAAPSKAALAVGRALLGSTAADAPLRATAAVAVGAALVGAAAGLALGFVHHCIMQHLQVVLPLPTGRTWCTVSQTVVLACCRGRCHRALKTGGVRGCLLPCAHVWLRACGAPVAPSCRLRAVFAVLARCLRGCLGGCLGDIRAADGAGPQERKALLLLPGSDRERGGVLGQVGLWRVDDHSQRVRRAERRLGG